MQIDEKVLRRIIEEVLREHAGTQAPSIEDIPVGVSNRHIHLTLEDTEVLFGKGAVLHVKKQSRQPGQYAAEETVTLHGPKGSIRNVRVLGPFRPYTQVEISKTDGFLLGVSAPVRESGDLDGTPGIVLEGPAGRLELKRGVIVAKRHIHLSVERANALGVQNKEVVSVETGGCRGCVLKNVMIHVSDRFAPEMHVDTDEANACELKNGQMIRIKKAQTCS